MLYTETNMILFVNSTSVKKENRPNEVPQESSHFNEVCPLC